MRTLPAVASRHLGHGRARIPLRAEASTPRVPYRLTPAIALPLAALMLLAVAARGATNDLTTTLQRGLFEEEANQNLATAVQAYEAVASQFDKDRKLAATAIFRLGECYRKQGNTNAAAAQYERILREFPDQPMLVTLSRQNLSALGSATPALAAPVLSD
jgi:tetratricopeptide (TPR) repeat protein